MSWRIVRLRISRIGYINPELLLISFSMECITADGRSWFHHLAGFHSHESSIVYCRWIARNDIISIRLVFNKRIFIYNSNPAWIGLIFVRFWNSSSQVSQLGRTDLFICVSKWLYSSKPQRRWQHHVRTCQYIRSFPFIQFICSNQLWGCSEGWGMSTYPFVCAVRLDRAIKSANVVLSSKTGCPLWNKAEEFLA